MSEKINENEKDNEEINDDETNNNNIQNTISIRFLLISYLLFFILYYIFYNAVITRSLSIIYEQYYNVNDDNNTKNNYYKAINTTVLKFQYISITILSILFIISNLLIYIFCLHGTRIISTLLTLITCVLGIIIPMIILCNIPIFIRVFENSIGYFIAKYICTTKDKNFFTFINKLFQHKHIHNVDYTFVFSMFTIYNFHELINNIKSNNVDTFDFHINTLNEKENLLLFFHAIISKHTIGQICWTYYAFVTAAILSHIIILPLPM